MNKILTLFLRDPENMSLVLTEVHPDCQWVLDGEGVPTLKLDGTACAILNGVFVRRQQIRKGQEAPYGFIPVEHDEKSGKTFGWVEVGNGSDDKYFREAFERLEDKTTDRTFELVGPKSQGGIEGYETHVLVEHGSLGDAWASRGIDPATVPRDYEGLRDWLKDKPIEGIVWHHEDGRMAKIKGRDFGYRRAR